MCLMPKQVVQLMMPPLIMQSTDDAIFDRAIY